MVNEQFDDYGNVLSIGNYKFVEGILGRGSYGTVRLARRVSEGGSQGSNTPMSSSSHRKRTPSRLHSSSSSRSIKEVDDDDSDNDDCAESIDEVPVEKKLEFQFDKEVQRDLARPRFRNRKSSSAPYGKNLFEQKDDRVTSTHVVGQLGLMVKNGLQKASSTVGSMAVSFLDDVSPGTNENMVAIKIYEKSLLKKMRTMERDKQTHKVKIHTALESVEREIALMKKIHHPNVVGFFEAIDSPESDLVYMVMEYMPLGEIMTYQDDGTFARSDDKVAGYNPRTRRFDESTAALFMVDILHGLAYLHQHRVCHRDLKPENILLDSRGIVKIGDFGVAHFFDDVDGADFEEDRNDRTLSFEETEQALLMTNLSNSGFLSKTEGTWCFWSPEMCESKNFSGFAADMWAAGICLYIFASGKLPYYSEIPQELFDSIQNDPVPFEGMGFSNSLIDLLKTTLNKDPNKRAGVGDCLNHPFLSVAREKRVRQLSVALEKSSKRRIIVNEEDIRKAFRVVTSLNPVELLKTTSHAIRPFFNVTKDLLSLSRGNSWARSEIDSESDEEDDLDYSKILKVHRPALPPPPAPPIDSDRTPKMVTRKQMSLEGPPMLMMTVKQTSTLSHGTSNISDVSSDDGRQGIFRPKVTSNSDREEKIKVTELEENPASESRDDSEAVPLTGKRRKSRIRRTISRKCTIM